MAFVNFSATNGYIPQATGQVIGYVRKPEQFSLNKYVQYIETKKMVGVYYKLERDPFVEVTDLDSNAWHDGDERPSGRDGVKVRFDTVEFQTIRRDENYFIGNLAIEQADSALDLIAHHAAAAASVMMTKRTRRVINQLETASNWDDHVETAATLAGVSAANSRWKVASDDPLSSSYNVIWKCINEGLIRIHKDTNGAVGIDDLMLLVSPELARDMAESPEITNYVRESPDAAKHIEGKLFTKNIMYGLPSHYKGVQIVVEDAMYVSTKKKAAGTQSDSRLYAKNKNSAILMSRPGSLDGTPGAPSFSTMQVYHYGGLMKVLSFNDQRNERLDGHVEENTAEKLAAPYSGFLIQGVAE